MPAMSEESRRAMRPTMTESAALDVALRLLKVLERGGDGPVMDAALGHLLADDVVIEEAPSRAQPHGARHGKAEALAQAARGRAAFTSQSYQVQNATAEADRVALEVRWSGTLAEARGELPAGATLRSRSAIFVDVRGGQISALRTYDCFEP
jgi:ketosteroid isomerase-like protein